MQFAGERARVDQLLRIDARGGAAGDVADVVGAGAARGEAEILHPVQHVERVRRADLADLQIGARRHVGIAAAEALGEIGEAGELMRAQNAVGHAQPAHERVLRRRDIKEAVEFMAEDVEPFREAPGGDVLAHRVPEVERMKLALCLLLGGELAAAGDGAVLGRAMDVGGGGSGWRGQRKLRRTPRHHAAQKPLEILLLLFAKAGLSAHATRLAPQPPKQTRCQTRGGLSGCWMRRCVLRDGRSAASSGRGMSLMAQRKSPRPEERPQGASRRAHPSDPAENSPKAARQ